MFIKTCQHLLSNHSFKNFLVYFIGYVFVIQFLFQLPLFFWFFILIIDLIKADCINIYNNSYLILEIFFYFR